MRACCFMSAEVWLCILWGKENGLVFSCPSVLTSPCQPQFRGMLFHQLIIIISEVPGWSQLWAGMVWKQGALPVPQGGAPPASCSAGALFTSQCFPPGAFVRRPGLRCEAAASRLLLHAWTEHDQFGCSQSLPGSAVTSASAHSTARQSRTGPSLFFFFNGREESLGNEQGSQAFLEKSQILSAW